jgi:glutamate racemase
VLTHGDAALRAEAASELVTLVESERALHRVARGGESSQALAAHGAMSEATRSEIRRRVIDEIVLPCTYALVKESQRGARPSAQAT